MGIFNLIFRNSGKKARTLLPAAVDLPEGYRGALKHDTTLCIGCSTCAHVCSPGAITLETDSEGSMWWQYNALRCTFCSRCAEYCPTSAIHLSAAAPVTALAQTGPDPDRSGLITRHLVRLQRCARCGTTFVAIPVPVLEQLMERDISSIENENFDMPALMGLCEKCRQRVTAQRFKESQHPTRR